MVFCRNISLRSFQWFFDNDSTLFQHSENSELYLVCLGRVYILSLSKRMCQINYDIVTTLSTSLFDSFCFSGGKGLFYCAGWLQVRGEMGFVYFLTPVGNIGQFPHRWKRVLLTNAESNMDTVCEEQGCFLCNSYLELQRN